MRNVKTNLQVVFCRCIVNYASTPKGVIFTYNYYVNCVTSYFIMIMLIAIFDSFSIIDLICCFSTSTVVCNCIAALSFTLLFSFRLFYYLESSVDDGRITVVEVDDQ